LDKHVTDVVEVAATEAVGAADAIVAVVYVTDAKTM